MPKQSFHPNLYTLPLRDRDPLSAIFPSIGIVIWIGAASCWAATQLVARALGYQTALGPPLVAHMYSPFALVSWALKFDHPARFGLEVHRVFAHGYAIVALGNALGIVVAAVTAARRLARLSRHSDLHGSAHWASPQEVRATGLLDRDRGVYVGAWRDPRGRIKYLRDASSAHELEFKATGAGKTVGSVIMSLLSWPGSVFCLDLKGGEVWHKTAGWRAASRHMGGLGQRAYMFDPTATDGSSVHVNPFDRIRIGTPNEIQDVQNIVELVADEGEKPVRGDNRFWIEMAKRLLVGLSLHVKHDEDPSNDSLPGVAATLADPRFDDLDGLFAHLRAYPHDPSHTRGWQADGQPTATHPLVAQVATQMLAMEERVKANVVAEAQSFLNLYSDPVIAANIASSDFKLDDLANGGVSLYFVVHPADKKRLRPLTRLITTQVLLALMQRSEHVVHPRVLIMLEEVAELGALDVVATALALGRGYGLKLFLIAQDLSQLETAWGSKSKTIIANCAIRIASAPNDLTTAELLSKMCGTMTVRHTVRNYSGSRLSALLSHTMTTQHDTQRMLLTPDEVMRLPGPRKNDTGEIVAPGSILVFVAGHAPIYGVQPLYFRDPTFLARAAIPPPVHHG